MSSNYKQILIDILLVLSFCCIFSSINATHVIGGNLNYECIGNNQYRVILEFRRDCFNGAVNAQFDDPASIAVYDANGVLRTEIGVNGEILIPFASQDTLNEILTSECKVIGEDVCVHRTTYIDTITLPDNDEGYFLSYQRCCRTGNLTNIVQPLETGATYWIFVSPLGLDECNRSARFNQWPSIYLCANDELVFDHSATDLDGDSLVYRLCNPSLGGTLADPKPLPATPPPYADVTFLPPYGVNDFLGGVPLTIDPHTGMMTGTPNLIGQYLVGVCVDEYRDGVLISSTRRDFEYNVRICIEEVISDFEAFPNPNCESLSVNFTNNSSDGDYTWYFDWPDTSLTSTALDPSYLYTAAGLYEVVLVTQDGDCTDTMRMEVGVSTLGDPTADFDFAVTNCQGDFTIEVEDQTATSQAITALDWTVIFDGNTTTYSGANPEINLQGLDGTAIIDLNVTTESGCIDGISKSAILQSVQFELAGDTLNICEGESIPLVGITDSNANYFWTPAHSLDLSDPASPIATPIDNTTYQVTVSAGSCEFSQMITVIVEDDLDYTVEIDPNFNCSEVVRIRVPGFDGLSFDWFDNSTFGSVLASGEFYEFTPPAGGQFIYARPSSGACQNMDSIFVEPRIFLVDTNVESGTSFCLGEQIQLRIEPSNANVNYTYQVNTGLPIVSDNGQGSLFIEANALGLSTINYTVTNEFGCAVIGALDIEVNEKIELNIEDQAFACPDGSLVLNPNPNPNYSYLWTSSPVGLIANPNDPSPQVIITGNSTFEVTATMPGSELCSGTKTIQASLLEPFGLSVSGRNDIYCQGTEANFEATVDDSSLLIEWHDAQGNILATGSQLTLTNVITQMVTAVAIGPNDCRETETFEVQVNPQLNLTLNTTNELACFGSTLSLNVVSNIPADFTWFDGQGNLINSTDSLERVANQNEVLTIKGVSADGCEAEVQVNLEVYPDLQLEISGLVDQYCFDSDNIISATTQVDTEFNWYDSNGDLIFTGANYNFTAAQNQEITLVASEVNGCTTESVIELNVSPEIGLEIEGLLSSYCFDSNNILSASNEIGAIINWYDAAGNLLFTGNDYNFTATNNQIITVSAENENGCIDSEEFNIAVYNDIDLSFEGFEDRYCHESDNTIFANTTIDSEVKWFDAAGNLLFIGNDYDFFAEQNQILTVTAIDINGCFTEQELLINVDEPITFSFDLDGGNSLFYCEEGQLTTSVSSASNLTYTWINAAGDTISNGSTLNYEATGLEEIIVIATNELGCNTSQVLQIMPYQLAVEMSPDMIVCEGEETELGVLNLDNLQELSFTWSPQEGIIGDPFGSTIMVSPESETLYQVVITNMDGCSWTEEINVKVSGFDIPLEIFANTDELAIGDQVDLSTNLDPSYTYEWSPAEELDDPTSDSPTATPSMEITNYIVKVTNQDGCTTEASITVRTRFPNCDQDDVFVPNMFTPNGDGMNDVFRPKSVFMDNMTMVVFDRWGEKVYETNSTNGAWDGTFRGKALTPDVYGYYLKVECINGFEYEKQGNVTLVK